MSIAVIINSCYEYYETTAPIIIQSAKIAGIPPQNIYIVVGQCDFESDQIEVCADCNLIFCKYANIDYNGVIYFTQTKLGIEEFQKYDYFFYTHDTCEFLESFWVNIQKYIGIPNYIKLEYVCSKTMGFLNVKWFIENKKELMKYYANTDKSLRLKYKTGDFSNKKEICEKFSDIWDILQEDCIFSFYNNAPMGPVFHNQKEKPQFKVKKYSNEERLATVYLEPGIIIYQKNVLSSGPSLSL